MRYRRLGWERRSCSHGSNPLRLDGGCYTLGRRRAALQNVFWQTDRLQPIDGRGEGRSGDLCQFGHVEKTITAQQRLERPFVRMRLERIQPPKSLQSE